MARKCRQQSVSHAVARPEPKTLRLPEGWLVPVLVCVMVLIGLGLRISDLRADPPPTLSWSFAPLTDEGLNTYSARNLILYGSWKVDDFFPFVVYPLFNLLVALVFKIAGIGFLQARLVSVAAGVAAIWVLYLLVKEEAGKIAGLLAALGAAVCYPLVMYNRLGLVEPLEILLLLLTGLFFSRGVGKPRLAALSGLFAASTVLLVKASALFVAPVMVSVYVWQFVQVRSDRDASARLRRGLLFFLAGVGIALLIWFFLVFLPHRADYVRYVLRHSFESPAGHPDSVATYLYSTFTVGAQSWLLPKLPFVAAVGFLFLPGIARKPGLRFLLAWVGFGVLMLGYMNYRPPRYEVILLPPLVAGFGVVLGRLLENGEIPFQSRPSLFKSALLCLWFWPMAGQVVVYTQGFWGSVRVTSEAEFLWLSLAVAGGLAAAVYFVTRLLRSGVKARAIWLRVSLTAVLLFLALRLDAAQFLSWSSQRTHRMVQYSKDLDQLVPDDAVVAGGWAPAMMMESRKRALCLTDWANIDDPIGEYGVTHLVGPQDSPDLGLVFQRYPMLEQRSHVIRRHIVEKVTIHQTRKAYLLEVFELPTSQ